MWRRGREVFIHVRVLLTTRRHTPPLGDGHPGGHLRAIGRGTWRECGQGGRGHWDPGGEPGRP